MRINIMVDDLTQLQDWVTKAQTIAENLSLPHFSFDFGECKRCESGQVYYPQAIDTKGNGFDILCHDCGIKLTKTKESKK